MAHSPAIHDRGTRFTNYSSIHSADAFVGDYQVMFTPGSQSPVLPRGSIRKPSRFSNNKTSTRPQNVQNSYMLPSNIPNTSQILPDHGSLPNVQIHYTIPADEKQIVASLRRLQKDLEEAMRTINDLTRERDEALHELKVLRVNSRKASSPMKERMASRIEQELFDISRSEEAHKKAPVRMSLTKRVSIEKSQAGIQTISDDAKVLSHLPTARAASTSPKKQQYKSSTNRTNPKHAAVNDTEQSMMMEDPTAASNTSRRRRRHSLDENMTSAYILQDITVNEAQDQQAPKAQVSKEAQSVLHQQDPEHIASCGVCQRLTKQKKVSRPAAALQKMDYTAQVTELIRDISFDEPTTRPKIPPAQALENVKRLLTDQFEEAKRKHSIAWEKYDAIEAPLNSKRHAAASQELFYWSKKMEECRINLDQLRDVEEGMVAGEEI